MLAKLIENGGRFKPYILSTAMQKARSQEKAISGAKHKVFHSHGYKANYSSL